jgi:hypothetical protein
VHETRATAPPADEQDQQVEGDGEAVGDLGLLTEVFWAALHGLATLTRGGRLPAGSHDRRLAILLARFVPAAGPGA